MSYHSVAERGTCSFDDPGLGFTPQLAVLRLILLQFGWYRPLPSENSPSVTSFPCGIGNGNAIDDLGLKAVLLSMDFWCPLWAAQGFVNGSDGFWLKATRL